MTRICRSMAVSRIDEDAHMVYGIAATENKADDGMVVPLETLRDAWDDYMRFANVREMHQDIAAGVVQEYEFNEAERHLEIGVKVADESTWQKIKAGVLKGFSIAGDILAIAGEIVQKIKLVEISLVDRPADEGAVITLFRAAGARDEINRGTAPEGDEMGNPTAPQPQGAGAAPKIKRDAGGAGGVTDMIADQEGSPMDQQLDVIGLLMQEFGKIKELVDSLSGGGDGVHPDVLAHVMNAHKALGRAINSHVSSTTAYGKDGGDGDGDGGDGGEGGAAPEPAVAKRAAQVLQQARVQRAAAVQDPRVDGLIKAVEGLVQRAATPQAQYKPAIMQRSADAGKVVDQAPATKDEFGPLEGTPEFDALDGNQKCDISLQRSAKARRDAAFTIPAGKE